MFTECSQRILKRGHKVCELSLAVEHGVVIPTLHIYEWVEGAALGSAQPQSL